MTQLKDTKQPGSSQNSARLVRAGKEYFDLLIRLINEATQIIHLQTYIYDDDETGILVGNALKAAAGRNVAVYLLADGYASQVMSRHFIDELRNSGVHFRFFEPLLKSKYFYFGRRMHHKIAVFDETISLVGGINISNHYNDMPGKPAWLDFALCTKGPVSKELHLLCWKAWNDFPSKIIPDPDGAKNNLHHFTSSHLCEIKMRRNDWVRKKNEIFKSYAAMFGNAKSHITILSSYFLPGKKIRQLLRKASARGVHIKVITAGPSDVMLAKHAERWLYGWLLRNNIELYEYQSAILHAKVAVCDNEWFTIGSYNINDISTYASVELNLDVYNPAMAAEVEQTIYNIIKNEAIPITLEEYTGSKNIFKQFVRWFSYKFIRIAFYLVTSYYKQKG